MKKFVLISMFCLVSLACFAQSLGISFYDQQGREFVVYVPSGRFTYSMYADDFISRDYNGRISRIGDTFIFYDYAGRVSRIGDVFVFYDTYGRVNRVGNLFVFYDYNGNVTHTTGSVQ